MYSFARTKEYQKSARYFRGAGGTNQGLLALDNPKAERLHTKNPSRYAKGFFVFRRFESRLRDELRESMPFAVTTFPVKKYLRNDRSRFGDTNIKILFPLMMAKANAAAIFNRAALPKALPGSLLCRNISRKDCPAPAQGRPAFPAVALPPVLPSGQSGAVRRARRALSGTAWLIPRPRRWKQPRRSGHSRAPRRQPAGRRCPCSMHRGCRCSTG